jgi:hypothetical protein
MKYSAPCRHDGPIVECNLAVSDIIAAILEGADFVAYGTCLTCGNRVERAYSASATLPTLGAELLKTNSLVADKQVLPWSADLESGVPAEIYVVHAGEGLTGACGRNGMALAGIHGATKQFVYGCRCGFEWLVCAQDLGQMIVQGLHKSAAARRGLYSAPPRRS